MLSVWSSRNASKASVLGPVTDNNTALPQSNDSARSSTDDEGPQSTTIPISGDKPIVTLKSVAEPTTTKLDMVPERSPAALRRLSLPSLAVFNGSKTHITAIEETKEREKAHDAAKRANVLSALRFLSSSAAADRSAEKHARAVQQLIIGSTSISPATGTKASAVTRTQLARIKTELMQPKSANRLIAKLRALPMPEASPIDTSAKETDSSSKAGSGEPSTDTPASSSVTAAESVSTASRGPIHAVCLEDTDASIASKHFTSTALGGAASITSSPISSLTALISSLHVVDLLSAPDLGFGQPGDGEGLLAGAVPTPEAIVDGARQLMALGYASDRAFLPSLHDAAASGSIHPPLDRLSILTYWWGFELCLPPPTLAHLAAADSVSHQLVNLLTVLASVAGGVRELLPFVRYASQFVDFEFDAIRKMDRGKGVVCAATWIMPAAMVPRAWDFPDAPPPQAKEAEKEVEKGSKPTGTPPTDEERQDQSSADIGSPGPSTPVNAPSPPDSEQPSGSTNTADPSKGPGDVVPNLAGGLLPTLLVTPPSVIRSSAPAPAPAPAAVQVA